MSPMAEIGPTTSRPARTGDSYASQWNRFVDWSQVSGRRSLPASPEDVAAYLEDRSETGARPSTLRVAAAAIARNHKDAGFDVPVHEYVACEGRSKKWTGEAGVSVREWRC